MEQVIGAFNTVNPISIMMKTASANSTYLSSSSNISWSKISINFFTLNPPPKVSLPVVGFFLCHSPRQYLTEAVHTNILIRL